MEIDNKKEIVKKLSNLFKDALKEWSFYNKKKTDKDSLFHKLFIHEILNALKELKFFDSSIKIKSSYGQGTTAEIPWIIIYDKNCSTGAREGINIVFFLTKKQKLFISLNMGCDYFVKKYKEKNGKQFMNICAKELNKILKENCPQNFTIDENDLDLQNESKRAQEYKLTNILSKQIELDNLDDFLDTIEYFTNTYSEIIQYLKENNMTYVQLIENIVRSSNNDIQHLNIKLSIDDAISETEQFFKKNETPINCKINTNLEEVKPLNKKVLIHDIKKELDKIGGCSKIDWVSKAHKDAAVGLKGEELALKFEIERLKRIGLSSDECKWVSQHNDQVGYDIESYDIINGTKTKIYIEVKTTTSKYDCRFFVSLNEKEKANALNKQYYIYRIYDINNVPKIYRACGKLEDNFEIDPWTFTAISKFYYK